MTVKDPMERLVINLAEGVLEEYALEARAQTAGNDKREVENIAMVTKGIQLYIGMILSLSGAILAAGRGATAVVILTGILFALELLETAIIPERKKTLALVMLSGSVLLVSVLEIVETVGRNFNMNVFYLIVMLIGSLLMFIEAVRAVLPKGSAK